MNVSLLTSELYHFCGNIFEAKLKVFVELFHSILMFVWHVDNVEGLLRNLFAETLRDENMKDTLIETLKQLLKLCRKNN